MVSSVYVEIAHGTLDPTRPAALRRFVSREEWDTLVDAVQDAFEPLDYCHLVSFRVGAVYTVAVLCLAVLVWVKQIRDWLELFLLVPFVLMFGYFCIAVVRFLSFQCCFEAQTERRLDACMDAFMRLHPNISLHLKQRRFYTNHYHALGPDGTAPHTPLVMEHWDPWSYSVMISVDEEV